SPNWALTGIKPAPAQAPPNSPCEHVDYSTSLFAGARAQGRRGQCRKISFRSRLPHSGVMAYRLEVLLGCVALGGALILNYWAGRVAQMAGQSAATVPDPVLARLP